MEGVLELVMVLLVVLAVVVVLALQLLVPQVTQVVFLLSRVMQGLLVIIMAVTHRTLLVTIEALVLAVVRLATLR